MLSVPPKTGCFSMNYSILTSTISEELSGNSAWLRYHSSQ
jgi:hypothetical protein